MPDRFRSLVHLPAHVALLDAAGVIVEVNEPWRAFAQDNGMDPGQCGVGENYLHLTARTLGEEHQLTRELRALLTGRSALLTWAYPCHSPDRQRWFNLIGVPLEAAAVATVALIHLDITSLVPLAEPGCPGPDTSRATLMPVAQSLMGGAQLDAGLSPMPIGPKPQIGPEQLRSLTARQVEILLMIGRGLSTAQIADALSASPNTVKAHTGALLKRLNLKGRTQLAIAAAELVRHSISAKHVATR